MLSLTYGHDKIPVENLFNTVLKFYIIVLYTIYVFQRRNAKHKLIQTYSLFVIKYVGTNLHDIVKYHTQLFCF